MDELVESAASLSVELNGKRYARHSSAYQKFLII
jgi:hypothetical protein